MPSDAEQELLVVKLGFYCVCLVVLLCVALVFSCTRKSVCEGRCGCSGFWQQAFSLEIDVAGVLFLPILLLDHLVSTLIRRSWLDTPLSASGSECHVHVL